MSLVWLRRVRLIAWLVTTRAAMPAISPKTATAMVSGLSAPSTWSVTTDVTWKL